MNFVVCINNSFGGDDIEKFKSVTGAILECADELNFRDYSYNSDEFRYNIIDCCANNLKVNFPLREFEYFFTMFECTLYFIVNNIIEHVNLKTASDKHIYYEHSVNARTH